VHKGLYDHWIASEKWKLALLGFVTTISSVCDLSQSINKHLNILLCILFSKGAMLRYNFYLLRGNTSNKSKPLIFFYFFELINLGKEKKRIMSNPSITGTAGFPFLSHACYSFPSFPWARIQVLILCNLSLNSLTIVHACIEEFIMYKAWWYFCFKSDKKFSLYYRLY
jgi:hypothetical protein